MLPVIRCELCVATEACQHLIACAVIGEDIIVSLATPERQVFTCACVDCVLPVLTVKVGITVTEERTKVREGKPDGEDGFPKDKRHGVSSPRLCYTTYLRR